MSASRVDNEESISYTEVVIEFDQDGQGMMVW
jgi:hypothetical protein